MARKWFLPGISLASGFLALTLGLSANSQQNASFIGKVDALKPNKETLKMLGGPDRYLTFVSTDKPIYKSGEKVYVRGVLLNAANHKPLTAQGAVATIQIKGPKGDTVASGTAQAQDSVWAFAWEVPAEQAGGEYKILATYPWNGHAPAERKFDIRAYRAPRLKSQITFLRDGYAPGDKVQATLDVKRAEGGIPEGAKVTVTARVDGMEIDGGSVKVDDKGLCSVAFNLPHDIPKGEGTLALIIEDGGVVETASKTIPILLQTVDLKIYPEGGDLLSACKNRVYIQAKQPNGKPADIAGKIECMQGGIAIPVGEFRTEHEGRGRFEFTPEAGKEYFLSISEPAGIRTKFPLPHSKNDGAVIHSDKNIYEKNQPVTVQVGCSQKDFRVTLSKREEELAAVKVDDNKKGSGLHGIKFDLPDTADGVLTVTVWDEKGAPLAERLIFRESANPVKISITADRKSYVPGEKAKLTVKATDAQGKPVSAMVGVTVTDDSVLEMVEKREQAPRLPVMVFLEPEVEDLADAHVYLDASNPKAPLATDLLLGTQGWRRFALLDLPKFLEEHGDQARRALALKIQAQTEIQEEGRLANAAPGNERMRFMVARAAVPMPMAMPPNAPMAALAAAAPKGQAMDKDLAKLDAPREVEIIDERPLVRDFREANKQEVDRQQIAGKVMQAPPPPSISAGDAKLQNAIAGFAEKKKRAAFADELSQSMSNLIYVREFAHEVRPNRVPTDRVDFTETLYWNAGVKTSATTGEATISFALNDSVSTFRVFTDAFTDNGSVGSANIGVESVQPFYAEAKLPLEVTSGDRILLPISLVNASTNALNNTSANVSLNGNFKLGEQSSLKTELGSGERVRLIQAIDVGAGNGDKEFTLTTAAGAFHDKVVRSIKIKPKGFPVEVAFGGLLKPNSSVEHMVNIPNTVVDASISSNCGVYPTPLANMTEALSRMIQDPYGCFEQTSSTSYPLTMAQQYFLSHTGVDPKLVETSKQKLDAGYKRLVSFWCPDKGYEWFGENPGHEALTAFGLLHFSDMAQVRDVDRNMIDSTRAWLLKQKDGKGGFNRNRRALHTWIEDKDCSNAYIVWALLETGQAPADLKAEVDSLKAAAAQSNNAYVWALAANGLFLAGEKAEAKRLMDKLASKQKADGSIDGISASIVGSGGDSLIVEGTSLATLAWLRDSAYAGNVEKSIKYLADSCQGGRYGSTQATVLALRSIVTYDKQRARPKAPGKVRIYVDGQSVGDWREFSPSSEGAIKLPNISELLTPGQHKIELKMEGGGEMPYSLAVNYNALTPASSDKCKMDIQVNMAQAKVTEGNSTEANVLVVNKTNDVLPNPVAIVGLPGGLEARHDQLKELVKKGKIDAYEVRGREVVLYWRGLPAQSKTEIPLSLIAAVPGSYTGPASRAYLYYTDEDKKWVDGSKVEITAK